MVEAISEAVSSEIETELINASHTNVLLLRQVIPFWPEEDKTCSGRNHAGDSNFKQGQKLEFQKCRCLGRVKSGTSTLKPTYQNWRTGDIHIKSIGKKYGTDFDIRELLEAVRKWEESEMTGAKVRYEFIFHENTDEA